MPTVESLLHARELLGLDNTTVRAQAEYYRAYARQLEGAADRDDETPWTRLSRGGERWSVSGVVATTHRLAAQFAFLVDPAGAVADFRRSAHAYLAAGSPFGLFLLAAATDDVSAADLLMQSGHVAALDGDAERAGMDPVAVSDPVQQTYLLIAYTMHPVVRREVASRLSRLHVALLGHAQHPIGPQSAPLGEYLALCAPMLEREDADLADGSSYASDGESVAREPRVTIEGLVAERFGRIEREHARSLRIARGNRYLWDRGAAPVNYVDLELVALAAHTLRAGGLEMRDRMAASVDEPLADLSVWAGATLLRTARQERPDR